MSFSTQDLVAFNYITQQRMINPLNIPEIQGRIASYLPRQDCVSCLRVCREWYHGYLGPVWCTIDLNTQTPNLEDIVRRTHLIRSIAVSDGHYLKALGRVVAGNLWHLSYSICSGGNSRIMFNDFLRHNMATLRTLVIYGERRPSLGSGQYRQNNLLFIYGMVPYLGSNLTRLTLVDLSIVRDILSAILESSPGLRSLSLTMTSILHHKSTLAPFQHQGITTLSTSMGPTWAYDNLPEGTACLLVHFPFLESWTITEPKRYKTLDTAQALRANISAYCPRLKSLCFEQDLKERDHNEVLQVLVEASVPLESCVLPYIYFNHFAMEGLLKHQEGLVYLELSTRLEYCHPYAPDMNSSAKEHLDVILRCCRRLEVLSIKGHRMDVAMLEAGCRDHQWVCSGLQELRVRFKGLETMTAVDDCLEQLWTRKRIAAFTEVDVGTEDEDESIGTRVCDQLMRFRRLHTVWLGTQDYFLAPHV